jgi:hypothetical protein
VYQGRQTKQSNYGSALVVYQELVDAAAEGVNPALHGSKDGLGQGQLGGQVNPMH